MLTCTLMKNSIVLLTLLPRSCSLLLFKKMKANRSHNPGTLSVDDNFSSVPVFCCVTLSASKMGKGYEAQVYIGTRMVNAVVLSAAISLNSHFNFAISGMTRNIPVNVAAHVQSGKLLQAGGSFHLKLSRMERWR